MDDVRQIVIGAQPDKPALALRPTKGNCIAGTEVDKGNAIWKSLAALHGLPDALIAAQAHSSRLMEVAIRGDLIPAADGSGFRAFAIGKDGIVENAKLFSPDRLTTLIDRAALWRFASIVVAQKHLADISKLLANIEKDIAAIADFLRDEQGARIEAALSYLKSADAAMEDGDRSSAIRIKLHDIGLDMDGIQRHVEKSFSRQLNEQVKDDNLYGYDSLFLVFQKKLNDLSDLLKTHQLATLTRIAALRLLASYQGEGAWKKSQAAAIAQSVDRYKDMRESLENVLNLQVDGWSGRGEVIRRITMKGIKEGISLQLIPFRIARKLLDGTPVFRGMDELLQTPELDQVKTLAKECVSTLAEDESRVVQMLNKALYPTEHIMLEPEEPLRFLVEWGQNAPLSIRCLSS